MENALKVLHPHTPGRILQHIYDEKAFLLKIKINPLHIKIP